MIGLTPAEAAGAICTASPTAGGPGTVFAFACAGFGANKILNTYVVEPDGRALSGAQVLGLYSNVSAGILGAVRSDAAGSASFVWMSAGGEEGFANALGKWTWVVQELAADGNGAAANRAQVTVEITSVARPQSGAKLGLELGPNAVHVWGSGFIPNEYANVWVTLPSDCSGRYNVEGASAVEPWIQGMFDGFSGPSSVKANERGEAQFALDFTARACRGQYTVTVRALGSGRGGFVSFHLAGGAAAASAGATLTAFPASVSALSPYLILTGSGFPSGALVNCWTTRPDGRSFGIEIPARVSAASAFSLPIHASALDSFAPLASEEPGKWHATCRAPGTGVTAAAPFWVVALFAP